MSDFPQGADWWKAGDGLWYPPATKPEVEGDDPPPPPPEPDGGWATAAGGTKPAEDGNGGRGCLIAIGITIALVVIFSILGSGDDDGGGDSADELRFGAFDVCTQFVEERLKAPGTASFRNYFEDDGEVTVTGVGDGPYTVRSSVDAQNSFGAEIRTDFTCIVTHQGDGNWRLNDLALDG